MGGGTVCTLGAAPSLPVASGWSLWRAGICSSATVPPFGALEETPAPSLWAGHSRAPRLCIGAAALGGVSPW
jgi:hypothetical protein